MKDTLINSLQPDLVSESIESANEAILTATVIAQAYSFKKPLNLQNCNEHYALILKHNEVDKELIIAVKSLLLEAINESDINRAASLIYALDKFNDAEDAPLFTQY